ncbi:MAG TPA: hypothetical protein VN893_12260 [Bryobacteraceae bacterium]|nr:hypothetical protein [Bryobacteraceae bacterium]
MAEPCLRFVTSSFSGGMATCSPQYIRGRNTRGEHRNQSGDELGPLRVNIHNRDLGYLFLLEPASQIYTACRVNQYGGPIWAKPRRADTPKLSGRTVHTHTVTIDTGERREMFGYTARRVIKRSRAVRDEELMSESESDGWYIDPPAAWENLYPARPGTYAYLSSGPLRDEHKFTEEGKRELGFLLLVTNVSKSYHRDERDAPRVFEHTDRREVIEMSEDPLPAHLFVPPSDFKRVLQLPEERYAMPYRLRLRREMYLMRLRWEMLRDSPSLRRGVAHFTG